MPRFRANADYQELDRDPLQLTPGCEVTAGPADRAWPGWIWVRDAAGRHGYVPAEILDPLGEGRFAVAAAFDPRVLAVTRGDALESLHECHGWHWCRNPRGEEGWVPGYLLSPAE